MSGILTPRGRALFILVGGSAATLAGIKLYSDQRKQKLFRPLVQELSGDEIKAALEWRPPSRSSLIERLKASGGREEASVEDKFDLLIIGGGATGTGCALDGASRGLKVALVERDDFSSETSSKSTKLVHGGVRYLEKAFLNFDREQFDMVREALYERATFLKIAPHLSGQLPIMVPIYKWWMIPYYWAGSKAYDFFAGSHGLESSYFLTKSKALEAFPMLKRENLSGAMIYYDGTQNDARTNLALALTAIQQGAVATSYTEVVSLLKDEQNRICGATIKDRISGETFSVHAKGVINATGPFCDTIRQMDDPDALSLVQPSVGTHVILPNFYSPRNMGLVDPASTDGRVIFFLPWEGNTIAGTTDSPSRIAFDPKAPANDISFILNQVRGYLDPVIPVRRCDILAAWAGIRPLVRNPNANSTQELVRNHIIMKSDSGLLTIAGGKWTTYRRMAEETIDASIDYFGLSPKFKHCQTEKIPLIGAHGYHENIQLKLLQQFGLETDVAEHLSTSYGDRCFMVAAIETEMEGRWPLYGRRLVLWYPYTEAEVRYAVRHEYAQTAVDVLARRTRLAHLSCRAAKDALPKVIQIMAQELQWSPAEQKKQHVLAEEYLISCGIEEVHETRAEFQRKQISAYKEAYLEASDGQRYQWERLGTAKALQAIEVVLREEGLLLPFDKVAVVRHIDPRGLDSVGLAEFLDGIAYVKNTLFPDQF